MFKKCKFHHAGIVVASLNDFVDNKKIIVDDVNKVKVAFLKIGDTKIELVEPFSDNYQLTKYIEKEKRLYHMAFSTNDFKSVIKEAKENNFIQIHPEKPAIAFKNKMIVWLYHDLYGLIELIEDYNKQLKQ